MENTQNKINSSNLGSYLPSQTALVSNELQPSSNSSSNQATNAQQETTSNSSESSFPSTPTTAFFKNMPIFPFWTSNSIQPITPTTQSLQSLLSPTSSSNPFFNNIILSQNQNDSITNATNQTQVSISPTSASNSFSLPTSQLPPFTPTQGKQYFHPHLQPNVPQYGFFTTGPLPTLVPNTMSNSMEQIANVAQTLTSGNPGRGKSSRPVMFRNLFHNINVRFLSDTPEFEQCRVYVDDSVAYSGNAKRYKKNADKDEKALRLSLQVFDLNNRQVSQCHQCKDYFEQQKYFKANSDCMGKFALVKSNSPIKIENGSFKVLAKMMCCCQHHNAESFNVVITCTSLNTANPITFIARSNINVKQWRKSNQKKEELQFMLSQSV